MISEVGSRSRFLCRFDSFMPKDSDFRKFIFPLFFFSGDLGGASLINCLFPFYKYVLRVNLVIGYLL